LKKTKWTPEEDDQLRLAVQAFGTGSWNQVAELVPSRTGKQCRERWIGQLAPSVSRETWSLDEDAVLVRAHATAGNRWTAIAAQLPGRSALHVKNRWNRLMRRVDVPFTKPPPRAPDIVEKKQRTVFEPIAHIDGLFGIAFREFQAKMWNE
jgi:hypothetical protein